MAVYAIIDSIGKVLNLAEWDGVTDWVLSNGQTAVLSDGTAQIGGTYANNVFSPPSGE